MPNVKLKKVLKLHNYTNTWKELLVAEAQLQVASIFHCFKMQIEQKTQWSETGNRRQYGNTLIREKENSEKSKGEVWYCCSLVSSSTFTTQQITTIKQTIEKPSIISSNTLCTAFFKLLQFFL